MVMPTKMTFLIVPSLLLLWSCSLPNQLLISATLSNPFRPDGDINQIIPEYNDVKKIKAYHNMTPKHRQDVPLLNSQLPSCGVNPQVKWSANVGSSVYSTPVIFPSGPDGTKQIFLATFYQYVEVLGFDGFKPWGFPLGFDGSSFQSSPILYDIDGDGTNDMAIIDKNANLYWVRLGEFGQYLEDFHIQVPKLKVKKDWADGMDPAFLDSYVMTSMFDNRFEPKKITQSVRPDDLRGVSKTDTNEKQKTSSTAQRKLLLNQKSKNRRLHIEQEMEHWTGRVLMAELENEAKEEEGERGGEGGERGGEGEGLPQESSQDASSELLEIKKDEEVPSKAEQDEVNGGRQNEVGKNTQETQTTPTDTALSREKKEWEQKRNKQDLEDPPEQVAGEHDLTEVYSPPHWDDFQADPINPVDGGDPMQWTDDYNTQKYRHWERRSYFGDDYFGGEYGGWGINDTHFAFVDAHVLASATLADINKNGNMELIIPISYYFDKEEYRGRNLGFDPANFLAGGIGCWNIKSETWTWLVHLDLTTDKTKFKALIHSSPTVADLDGDGRSEVIIGTSLGLLYVLDGDTGFSRRFFPMQFHEIQSQVVVADLRGGPDLEMIVGDLAGNVVCVNIEGDVLWDAHLSGGVYQPATIGDIDGDGILDVVVSVSAYDGYHIYALRGDTGEILSGYPIALPEGGEVSGAIILVDLHNYFMTRDVSLSPNKYSDPYVPKWTAMSEGHAPAASPSMINEVEKEEETPKTQKEEGNQIELEELNAKEEEEEEKEGEGEGNEYPDLHQKRRLDNLDPLSHKPRRGKLFAEVKGMSKEKKHLFPKTPGLHLLVPSFDGHLYIFDGKQTCAERIDLGDHIYSTPLVDDVTGDGNLDIIVGTVNGHVHVLETQIPHHSLNAWTSFPKYRGNVFTHGQVGISIPMREKKILRQADIKGGTTFSLTFDIWDTRPITTETSRTYSVSIYRGTNRQESVAQMEYTRPGRYSIPLPLSPPEKTLLVVSMTTDHAEYHEETLMIEVSTKFYIWMKYLILFPLVLLITPLLFMKPQQKF